MIFDNLYVAEVIDNNHEDKDGKVQIYVPVFMSDFNPQHYPWARQMTLGTGGSSDFGISSIPEIGSKVFVTFEKHKEKKSAFYIADVDLSENNGHILFEENIKSIVSSEAEYPDVKFNLFKNGSCLFFTSGAKSEFGFVHASGESYIFMNAKGEIELKAGSDGLESTPLGETLQTMLDNILTQVISHTHSSPVGPTSPPVNAAAFTTIKSTELPTILSSKIKNN